MNNIIEKIKQNKKVVLIIGIVLVLVIIYIVAPKKPKEEQDTKTVSSNKEITTEAKTEATTPKKTTEKKIEEATEKSDIELDKDNIVTILDISMAQGFEEDCYSVEYNDELDAYVISMWQENFVEMLAMAEGDEEVRSSWYEMVDSLKTSCNDMSESVKTMGDSSSVVMNILNDENKDNVLLTIADGEVIYDVLAE